MEVADNSDYILTMTDAIIAGGAVEGESEPDPESDPSMEGEARNEAEQETALARAVAPAGILPGYPASRTNARTMPGSSDPLTAARTYITFIASDLYLISTRNLTNCPPDELPSEDNTYGFVYNYSDGSFITLRYAGTASYRTAPSTVSVEINNPIVKSLNGGSNLKLKFPVGE